MEDPLVRTDWEVSRDQRRRSALSSLALNGGGAALLGVVGWVVLGGSGLFLVLFLAVIGVLAVWEIGKDFARELPRRGVALTSNGFRYSHGGGWVETVWANVADVRDSTSGEFGLPALVVILRDESHVETGGWFPPDRSNEVMIPFVDVPDLTDASATATVEGTATFQGHTVPLSVAGGQYQMFKVVKENGTWKIATCPDTSATAPPAG